MRRILIPPEVVRSLISEYKSGQGISYLSDKYDIGRAKIREILKDSRVYKSKGNYGVKYNWTDEDIKYIINCHLDDNISTHDIALKYGCHDTTILDILNNNGINTSRSRSKYNFTKYNVCENYFDIINTERKSYWLGFLLADGHISSDSKLSLTLQKGDVGHIEKFRHDIGSNHPIKLIERHQTYNITIGSKRLGDSLREKGFTNYKSWEYELLPIVESVPKELMNHFIRGYFDGDGCVGIYKQTHYPDKPLYHTSVLGLKPLMDFIREEVNLKGSISIDKRTIGTYQLVIRSRSEIVKLKKYLYKDANIFLTRKHDIFEKIN